ncbi:MAG: ATP-binding protein [Bryobacteraceae bacterium]|jgi:heavy metal sensor kinase
MRRPDLGRLSRGLRFRLTASYALIFALLFIVFAALFRERLKTTLAEQSQDDLNQEWAAMKGGYLEIDRGVQPPGSPEKAFWKYDETDQDESRTFAEIKSLYLIADARGHVINEVINENDSGDPAVSAAYKDLGIERPADIERRVRDGVAPGKPSATPFTTRRNSERERFLIRSGIFYDLRRQQPFYVAIGKSLDRDDRTLHEFTLIFVGVIPGALLLGSLMGWFMAGRALTPVLSVAQTAQRISGSNLSLRIPSRHAGDELDYLILTFNRMIEGLEASFQQIKQFSTDVSHELRTPITGIRGQLEVALFTAKTTDQYREAMFNALQDIDRLSQIVRALLLLSQAESGQLTLQKSRLNLSEILKDLVEEFQIPAEAAAVRLTADVPDHCFAGIDRVQIERMITNLLSNAIKFTPENGSVRVRLRPADDRLEIVVEDTGCGIPTEYLPHIFDRFYRVPGSGTAPGPEQGLGLGLSFVAWIVKAHEGKIDVESAPGKGTRFTITLPLADVPADALELERQPAG